MPNASCICMTQSRIHTRDPFSLLPALRAAAVEAAHGEEMDSRARCRRARGKGGRAAGRRGGGGDSRAPGARWDEGWLRFPPRCVITRHYPPIKSLSNNYLTVAVTHSRSPLSPAQSPRALGCPPSSTPVPVRPPPSPCAAMSLAYQQSKRLDF